MTKEAYEKIAEGLNEALETTRDSHGERVRRAILEAGCRLWAAGVDPSARRVGIEVGLTHPGILHHFKSSLELKRAIAFHAVKNGESRVIIQLIALGHPAVAGLSDAERQAHLRNAC